MVNKKCTLCNDTGRIVKEQHSENLITVRQCPRCNKNKSVKLAVNKNVQKYRSK